MTLLNLLKISTASFLLFSCSSSNEPVLEEVERPDLKVQISDYFEKRGEKDILSGKKAFVYYSEAMNCVKCTESMLKSTIDVLDNERVLFLFSGRGTAIDISSLIEKERENVFMDYTYEFLDEVDVNRSCYFLLNESNTIDTIVDLDAEQISTQVRLFLKHIRENS